MCETARRCATVLFFVAEDFPRKTKNHSTVIKRIKCFILFDQINCLGRWFGPSKNGKKRITDEILKHFWYAWLGIKMATVFTGQKQWMSRFLVLLKLSTKNGTETKVEENERRKSYLSKINFVSKLLVFFSSLEFRENLTFLVEILSRSFEQREDLFASKYFMINTRTVHTGSVKKLPVQKLPSLIFAPKNDLRKLLLMVKYL